MTHKDYVKDYNKEVIEEYQRLEQRNKIGLHNSKIRLQKPQAQIENDDQARAFIVEKIKMKEWNKEDHKAEESPTNAFGKIRFLNYPASKPAPYVRLSDKTDMQNVKKLVEDIWGMLKNKRKPYLVISVIGGSKRFNIRGKKRDAIKEAILAAAQPTNAWLVTDGINIGCSKLVGEIVKEGQFYIKDKDKSLAKMTRGLKAIGICSWGFLANKEVLVNNEKSSKHHHYYKTYNSLNGKNVNKPSLDPNHTHFLLVDNGKEETVYRRDVTKLFYGEFLKLLIENTSENSDGGLDIPVITLLIEGGPTSIEKLRESLDMKIPCVIMEGSGRAADIVANALKNKSAKTTEQEIEKMIKENFQEGKTNPNRRQDILRMTMEVVEHENSQMITIIDLNKEEEDRDKKILLALLSTGNFSPKKQMWFTLSCNRIDIAKELLSNESLLNKLDKTNNQFSFSAQDPATRELMNKILRFERVDFLELFLDNDFSLHKYLDASVLKELYNQSVVDHPEMKNLLLKHTLLEEKEDEKICVSLEHIHQFIKVFMWDHSFHYKNENNESSNQNPLMFWGSLKTDNLFSFDMENQNQIEEKIEIKDPDFELFIWAILSDKPQLAEFFLTKTKDPLLSLLFAAAFHKKKFTMSNRSNCYLLQEKANYIMEIAYENDADISLALLDKEYPRFGGETLKRIALNADLKDFLANTPCQKSIQAQWTRGFSHINHIASVFAIFFPILVLIPWSQWTPFFKFLKLGDDENKKVLRWYQKIFVFYRAPIVKYICNVISSIFLLLLYSFVALFYFGWKWNKYDISLFLMLVGYMIYEIREICNNKFLEIGDKIKNHYSTFWNKLDLAIYLIFIGSFVLKNFLATFMYGRILFAINGFLLYVRLLRVYHTSFSLGPKLIIFQKMLHPLKTFLVLLIVFIVGYGMASQALITPGAKFKHAFIGNYSLVEGILLTPYWQMYGELNLDEIDEKIEKRGTRSLNISLTDPDFVNIEKRNCTQEEIDLGYCEDFSNYNYYVKAMLGVYMLIGNIMLLNMLIAIFSHIYEDVEKNAKAVRWYELYSLVEEYDQMPGQGPIFFPFEIVYKTIISLQDLCFFARSKICIPTSTRNLNCLKKIHSTLTSRDKRNITRLTLKPKS